MISHRESTVTCLLKKVYAEFTGTLMSSLSEQIAHSTVDLHLREISGYLHGSVMNKNFTLPGPLKITQCASFVQFTVWHRPLAVVVQLRQIANQGSE